MTRRFAAQQPVELVSFDEPVVADALEDFDDLTIPEAVVPLPLDLAFDRGVTLECERALAATRRQRRRRKRVSDHGGTRADTPRARRSQRLTWRLVAVLILALGTGAAISGGLSRGGDDAPVRASLR